MPRIYTHSVDSDAKNVKSVALFAIQPADSWTKALGQCWRTRQWDIVPHPTDPMETSLLQDQHPAMHIPDFLSTPLLPSETQDEIFPGRLDMLIHMVFFYIFECFSELVYFALNNRKIYLQNGVEYCSNIPN